MATRFIGLGFSNTIVSDIQGVTSAGELDVLNSWVLGANVMQRDGDSVTFDYGGLMAGGETPSTNIYLYVGPAYIFQGSGLTPGTSAAWRLTGRFFRYYDGGVKCLADLVINGETTVASYVDNELVWADEMAVRLLGGDAGGPVVTLAFAYATLHEAPH